MTKFEGPEESFRPANSSDSAFKLFGRTIPVRTDEIGGSSSFSSGDDGDNHNNNNNGFRGKVCGELEDDKTSSGEEINGEPDERHEEKMRKKTSKPVACPRCDSMDTKFCYFNNYSVNQPRHYCRNCQRYWTAGGSLRNVPVGAGRRKNKPSLGIHHAHIVEGDQCVWNEGQDFIPGNSEKLAKVEAFRPELDSFGQALNAASCSTEGNSKPKPGNYSHSETLNLPKAVRECFLSFGRGMDGLPRPESSTILPQGLEIFQKPDCTDAEKTELSPKSGESAEHPVDGMRCGSSVTVSGSVAKEPPAAEAESGPGGMRSEGENKADAMNWGNGCYPPFAGSPWPLYHNGSWAPATPGIHGVRGVQTSGMPWCQPGTGFLPAVNGSFPSYLLWGQAWGMPWRPANADSSSTALGKHQRDEMPLSESKCDGSLWAPKTLRINDPADEVRSSIWASLGLGKKPGFINSDGILKAFQPKMEDIASAKTTPVQILGASPAALSRSASFVESS